MERLQRLKGSYYVAKNNIICCNWCNAKFIWFKVQKTHYFHILYIIVAPLCPAFLKCVDFQKAHRFEKQGML